MSAEICSQHTDCCHRSQKATYESRVIRFVLVLVLISIILLLVVVVVVVVVVLVGIRTELRSVDRTVVWLSCFPTRELWVILGVWNNNVSYFRNDTTILCVLLRFCLLVSLQNLSRVAHMLASRLRRGCGFWSWQAEGDAGEFQTIMVSDVRNSAIDDENVKPVMSLLSVASDTGRRVLSGSSIMQSTSPELPRALLSMMRKACMSQRHSPSLLESKRKYPVFFSDKMTWKQFPESTKLSYQLPHGNNETYYLLQDYHGGLHGKVWLSADAKGHLAVIKIARQVKYGNTYHHHRHHDGQQYHHHHHHHLLLLLLLLTPGTISESAF